MRNQRTTQHARRLRREQTPFEAVLWATLRDRQLEGYKFRRQHPIPPFVADFACPSAKLVVELDGRVHDESVERDANRDAVLEEQGWQVVRFSNVQLLQSKGEVVQTVFHLLQSRGSACLQP